jgi:hypothetical protein
VRLYLFTVIRARLYLLCPFFVSLTLCTNTDKNVPEYLPDQDSVQGSSIPDPVLAPDTLSMAVFPFMPYSEAHMYRTWDGWPDSTWNLPLGDEVEIYFQKPFDFLPGDTAIIEEYVGEYLTGQLFWFRYPDQKFDSTYVTLRMFEVLNENFDPGQKYGIASADHSEGNWFSFTEQAYRWRGWSEEVLLSDSSGYYRVDMENEWDGYWEQRRQEIMGWQDTLVDFSGEAANVATVSAFGKPCTHMIWYGLITFYCFDGFGPPKAHYVKVIFSYGC